VDYYADYQQCINGNVVNNNSNNNSSSSNIVYSSSRVASSSSISPSSSSIVYSSSRVVSSSSRETPLSSSIVSSSSILPSSSSVNSFCDIKDYRTVQIGNQTWMAENLNCNASGNVCYGNLESNCDTYGRLYDWATAKKVCPSGWHLPSKEDWDALINYVESSNGCSNCAGTHLKATSSWYDCGPSGSGSSYLCEDTHGFSALSDNSSVGFSGDFWWGSSGAGSGALRLVLIFWSNGAYTDYHDKSSLFSVRCLKD
jgi:uncharacterized protein (TIGR02145 family)